MSATTLVSVNHLIRNLRLLCAHPSTTNQPLELADTARVVADMLRQTGLDATIVRTPGAPVVIGKRDGRNAGTLLLYHHYDVAPPGPWRSWSHEPFQLAEREEALYGRGVAHGKGPLVAHLHAIQTLLATEGDLPCSVMVIVEGEGMIGSPNLAEIILKHVRDQKPIACLSSGGERDVQGRPFCYSGSKGLLQVTLTVQGAAHPLTSGLAASVRNPGWRLLWALSSIKGEDEDIRFNGFYDSVEGPGRNERATLRQVELDEAGRLATWKIPEFLFGMSGAALVRTEVTLPTCNLSSMTVSPTSTVAAIPTDASAQIDLQLVPQQHPDAIFELLVQHLTSRGFSDILIEKLAGSYPPVRTDEAHPFLQRLVTAGGRIYGTPLTLLPLGPFAQPLHIFVHKLRIPVAVVALARHTSAVHGANECLPLDDLLRHSQILIELLLEHDERVKQVALHP